MRGVFFFVLLLLGEGKLRRPIVSDRTKKVVTESSSFNSTLTPTYSSLMNNVDLTRPLALLITGKDELKNNPVTATLASNTTVTCLFESYSQLCVLSTLDRAPTLTLSCKNVPCQVSWQAMQLPTDLVPTQAFATDTLYHFEKGQRALLITVLLDATQQPTLHATSPFVQLRNEF